MGYFSDPEAFNIDLDYGTASSATVDQRVRTLATEAVILWEQEIGRDIADVETESGLVDDLLVTVSVGPFAGTSRSEVLNRRANGLVERL